MAEQNEDQIDLIVSCLEDPDCQLPAGQGGRNSDIV